MCATGRRRFQAPTVSIIAFPASCSFSQRRLSMISMASLPMNIQDWWRWVKGSGNFCPADQKACVAPKMHLRWCIVHQIKHFAPYRIEKLLTTKHQREELIKSPFFKLLNETMTCWLLLLNSKWNTLILLLVWETLIFSALIFSTNYLNCGDTHCSERSMEERHKVRDPVKIMLLYLKKVQKISKNKENIT